MARRPQHEVLVTHEHSFELVKIMVSAVISNVTFLREIFPQDECFELRYWDPSDHNPSYADFMNGLSHVRPSLALTWRTLVRGSNPAVDKLLDWVEIGVHDAIDKQYLKTVQLSFYEDEVTPSKMIECYTISFTYKEGVASMKVGTRIGASGRDSDFTVTLDKVQRDLRFLVNSVNVQLQKLPDLPALRFVSMHLAYNGTEPSNYTPPGFKVPNVSYLLPSNEGNSVGRLDTSVHTARIKVYSIASPAEPDSDRSSEHSAARSKSGNDTPTTLDHSISPAFKDSETQEARLRRLKDIGYPRPQFGDAQDTQPLNMEAKNEAALQNHGVMLDKSSDNRGPYSQPIMEKIIQARKSKETGGTAQHDPMPSGRGSTVQCECGVTDDKEHLVPCDKCDKLYHFRCYGYSSSAQLLSASICYTCMLDEEPTLLYEMQLICLYRRTLHFVTENGSPFVLKDLAQYLNSTPNQVISKLRIKGNSPFTLKRAPQGKRKPKSQKVQYEFVGDQAKLREAYFRPEFNIAHHVGFAPNHITNPLEVASGAFATNTSDVLTEVSAHERVFEEGSTTQGTPSPAQHITRTHVLRGKTSTASSPRSQVSGGARHMRTSKKRSFNEVSATPPAAGANKHLRECSANSPWLSYDPSKYY